MSADRVDSGTTDHHVVLSLEVVGGFLGGTRLEFADGLNCLIGGRGAGKTTALEFLRFTLGLMPDPRTSPQRHRAIETLVKANLGGGRLRAELRTKTDMRYTAERAANDAVQVLNEARVAVPVTLDRDQIFAADVFSQNEIEEIALSPAAQLELIDRFEEAEVAAITRNLEQLRRQVDQSGVDLRQLDDEIDDFRSRASEALAIEERLKGLAETGGPDADRINAAHAAKALRGREERVPDLLVGALQRTVRELETAEAGFRASVDTHVREGSPEGGNPDIVTAMAAEVQAFEDQLGASVAALIAAARATEARLRTHQLTLADRHATQDAEYRALLAESEELGGRAAERLTLQAGLVSAQAAAAEQQARERQRTAMAQTRNAALRRMSELRDQRFALRKRVAERLTQRFPSIRVTVEQAADLSHYRELVTDALRGAGIKHGVAADRLTQALLPGEFAQAVAQRDYAALVRRAGFDEDRARKVIDGARASGLAYTIEAVELEDRPCIELRDGERYKASPNLSTGQRCTTILPILLSQSERPLLIDQPEDNLDNAFVYDTIVKALRAVKGSRQVIFVTHNPNIPVLGEAERVFVFESDGQHAAVRRAGTVDECRDDIERILEGGRDAFLQRKTRYGH